MYWLGVVGGLVIGFIFGMIMCAFVDRERTFGTIKWVKPEDEDKPYLFLDMDKKPELMVGHKYVVFKTDLKYPQK